MANRLIIRSAVALMALTLGACATARQPDPEPIADTSKPDAVLLDPEFHNAQIGHDRLRGELPNE